MVDRKDYETYNAQTRDDIKRIKSLMWEMGQPKGEWLRPRKPGETLHQKEEPEVPHYNKGGPVLHFAKGGSVHYGQDYRKKK